MQDIIRLLPDALANQIAAGEVVQRPSSVVKELMENSIDADADQIDLVIADSGKSLIQVLDNGKGMSETDARMCFERHATSKISTTQDLFQIRTMGFRGEAMASISAVAQVNLKTREKGEELGTEIQIDASEVKFQEPCATGEGTSIMVKNLFYNVPARRNFLKSDGIEMKHIIDEFQHIAMAYPEKSFRLINDGEEIYQLAPGKMGQRIIDLLGKGYKGSLVACEAETDHLKLKGYIGIPESSKKRRGDQFLFVNRRFIRNNYLNHAITTAYESLLPEKYNPFYVLFMEMDPEHLDINVHPTKTEIKFDDERTVYGIVRAAVKQALGSHNIYPTLDFEADVNLMKQFEASAAHPKKEFPQPGSGEQTANRENWIKLFDENLQTRGEETERVIRTEDHAETRTFTSKIHDVDDVVPEKKTQLIQIANAFILSPFQSKLMVVDQKASLERIIYEKLIGRKKGKAGFSQRCLFPTTLEMSATDMALIEDIWDELKMLGFEIEIFGKNSIVINGIPADIAIENEKELFEALIEQYKLSKNDIEISTSEYLVRTLAKRSASNQLRKMEVKEMEELINQLFACANMNYSPDGKPTFKLIERTTIENFFK